LDFITIVEVYWKNKCVNNGLFGPNDTLTFKEMNIALDIRHVVVGNILTNMDILGNMDILRHTDILTADC
jgi:hypothetical protein